MQRAPSGAGSFFKVALHALPALASILTLAPLVGCETPALRQIPARTPLRVNGERLPTVGLVSYAADVDPATVSDGSFCPHADRALFRSFFSAPEEVLAEELVRQGYPVAEVPASMATAYGTRVQVSYVGDSLCESRVPLWGPHKAEDCSVRMRVAVSGEAGRGRVQREFERIGESSLHARVDAYQGPGPSRAWREALRDAVRQILEDRDAVGLLTGRRPDAPAAPPLPLE